VCSYGFFYLRHKHHFASYHHITSHSMHHTSFCITKKPRRRGEIAPSKILIESQKECVIAQHVPSVDILYYMRPTFVNNGIRKILFAKHEKKGRCFFAKGSKNCMYVDFMHHKEIYYINVHTNT
jgi:hypothetical protein